MHMQLWTCLVASRLHAAIVSFLTEIRTGVSTETPSTTPDVGLRVRLGHQRSAPEEKIETPAGHEEPQ